MTVRLSGVVSAATVLVMLGLAAPATAAVINGTSGPDVLVGTAKADTMHGYAGNDTLRGKGGADRIYGGRGADVLFGGADVKRDRLYGGAGADRIHARRNDVVSAGSGNDTITDVNPSAPHIACGPGTDRVVFRDTTMAIFGAQLSGCEHVVLCARGGTCKPWMPAMNQESLLGGRERAR